MNLKRLGLCLVLSFPLVFAQLSQEAQAALRQGKTLAAQAMNTYERATPDQDLWRAALEYGQEAERLAPERPEPQRFLAQVYTELGWWQRAWDAWQAYETFGGELDSDAREKFADMSASLGYSRYKQGQLEASLTFYEKAASLLPENKDALTWLALLHSELENPQAALPYWQAVVKAEPDNPLFASYLARTEAQIAYGVEPSKLFYSGLDSYEKGDLNAAIVAFAEASALNPGYEDALLYAARVSLELGQPETSLAYWQRVLALNPEQPEARVKVNLAQDQAHWGIEATTRFREGVAAYAEGRLSTAQTLFNTVTELNPDYTDAWAWLGKVTQESGQLEVAANAYGRASALEPNNSDYRRAYQEVQTLVQARTQAATASTEISTETEQAETNQAEAKVEIAQGEPERTEASEDEETVAATNEAEETLIEIDSLANTEPSTTINEADRGMTNVAELEPANEEAVSFNPSNTEAANDTGGPTNSLLLLSFNHTHYRNGNLKTSPVSFFDPLESPNFNLEQPVNYAAGTLYQRLEVLNKPSDETVLYQVCLIPFGDITVAPACSDPGNLAFDERGVYTSNQPLSSFTNYDAIDWSKGIIEAVIVLRDANGDPIGNTSFDLDKDPINLDLYFPMSVQYNAILVPEGGAFTGWPEAVTFR